MNTFVDDLSNYAFSACSHETHAKKKDSVNNGHIELVTVNHRELIKDIFQELNSLKSINSESDFSKIAEKYGFTLDVSNNYDHKIQNLTHSLPDFQKQNKDYSLDRNNNRLDDILDILKSIRNEIRNQTLHRKSTLQQFTATTRMLDKAFANDDEITTSTSYAELWLRLAFFVGEVKTDYVDFYAHLMQKYTEMYESFNKNVQKASSDAVSTGDDGNNISFDTKKMQDGYNDFKQDVDRLNKDLGSINGWGSMSEEQKKSMTITLEPAYKVNDKGEISFNMEQYDSISDTYPSGIKEGKVSTVSYQAWLATFNSAGSTFQSNMQSFAQRYTQANNNFDTLNKILSAAISTLADSARDVLKSLN